jgi:hypothetical protein
MLPLLLLPVPCALRHRLAEPHQSLDTLFRVLEQIIGWTPESGLAEHDNGRAAKTKDGLFLSTLERRVEWMNLSNPAN